MTSRIAVGAALGAALFVVGAALADDTPKLTELSPNGADACFGRVYDAAHLKAHPKQKVARIFFYYGHDPVSRPNEEPSTIGGAAYDGFLTTTVRGTKKPEWAAGWCNRQSEDGKSGPIHCGMECDRTLASLKVDDKGRLIVSNVQPDVYLDAGAEEELGAAQYNKQALGSEDDNFRLDPMPAATCKAEFARIDPIDPALGAPLRERLKPDQAFCYGRDYDAAHLKSHPDQVTQSIRVFRGPVELASYASGGDVANWPDGADIAISVTTRQKSGKVTQTYFMPGRGRPVALRGKLEDQRFCLRRLAEGDFPETRRQRHDDAGQPQQRARHRRSLLEGGGWQDDVGRQGLSAESDAAGGLRTLGPSIFR